MKRKRALLESNSPRNSQLETHRSDEAGAVVAPVSIPVISARLSSWGIGEIDFPMPGKLNVTLAAREVVEAAKGPAASNSAGDR